MDSRLGLGLSWQGLTRKTHGCAVLRRYGTPQSPSPTHPLARLVDSSPPCYGFSSAEPS
jgi:hypothetical protein